MQRSSASRNPAGRRQPTLRRGAALVETLLALVVLAFTGAGMIALLAQTVNGEKHLHEREREMSEAVRALERVATFNRADLLERAGAQRLPSLWLEIVARPDSLFDVIVRDTLHRAELLHTTLYRPDSLP